MDFELLIYWSLANRKLEAWKRFEAIREKDEKKFLRHSKSLPGVQVDKKGWTNIKAGKKVIRKPEFKKFFEEKIETEFPVTSLPAFC